MTRHAAPGWPLVRGARGGAKVARESALALVRAIRRVYGSDYGGLERFTVTDIHDFARKLVEQCGRAE
jgi:hypothetical protein